MFNEKSPAKVASPGAGQPGVNGQPKVTCDSQRETGHPGSFQLPLPLHKRGN